MPNPSLLFRLRHLVLPAAGFIALGYHPGTASAADINVTINPAHTHPISQYIYGINFAAKVDGLPAALTLDRAGGNRWTAYNWTTNTSNAGSDYYFQNDNYLSDSSSPGAAVFDLIRGDQKAGMASLITVPMQGLVAGDNKGPVNVDHPPDRSRFKTVVFEKKSLSTEPFSTSPSTRDAAVYMDEFLWAIDKKFAGQDVFGPKPTTQPVLVELDNEPDLWNHTHLEIQGPKLPTADTFIAKTVGLATALKNQFPALIIMGPSNFGFYGMYTWSGEISPTPDGNNWFADRYMLALREASRSYGKPLVDVYAFHWYSEATDGQNNRVTGYKTPTMTDAQVQALVQSPRSLWDPTYKENSWITQTLGGPINILGRLQTRINADNPGMKIAITEYNNGGGQHIAGAVAQADTLGIFGAQGLYAANFWPLGTGEEYLLAGFRAFRDFDGAKHSFGDTSVEATSSDVAKVAAYVSTDTSRAGRVVIVAINRTMAAQSTTFTGQPLTGTAHLFQITATTSKGQKNVRPAAAGTQSVSGSALTVALQPMSVTTIDVY